MGGVLSNDHLPDLLAYANLIVHAAWCYEGSGWQVYDRNFRQQAEALRLKKWADTNASLWTMAFFQAKPAEHCTLYISLDHHLGYVQPQNIYNFR